MRILLAGGGTGGHLIPGISLAEEILKKDKEAKLLFISTGKPLEKQLFDKFKLPYQCISAKPLTKSVKKLPGFFYHTTRACLQSLRIVRQFKPEIIVGLGGYGAAPILAAGKMLRIPLFILEQNAIPGTVNRLFAPVSQKVCCQFESSLSYFQNVGLLTGNPIRSALKKEVKNAREQLGLDPNRFTLLVMGGSQGAQAINRCFIEATKRMAEKPAEWPIQIIHLAGANAYEELTSAYQKANIPHKVFSFLEEMELAYSSCDIAVCRSGGTSLAELTALGIPSILIPFPYAKADHQYLNALEIAQKGAAWVCKEEQFTPEQLFLYLKTFMGSPEVRQQMQESARKIGRLEAGSEIFSLIESTLKQVA